MPLSVFLALIVLDGEVAVFWLCQLVGRLACSDIGLFFNVEGRAFGLVGRDRVGDTAGVVFREVRRELGERFWIEEPAGAGAGAGTGDGMVAILTSDSWNEAIRTGMPDLV